MTGATTSKPVTAADIYYAYPGSDLLALDPPLHNETIDAYIERVGGHETVLNCGDTLFAFILFELSNCGSHEECVYMLEGALRDVLAVKTTLEKIT